MVTKGIVLGKKVGTNKYVLRVPYFESAGGSQSILEATLATPPGLSEGYAEGDIVQVAFEDRQVGKAVIVGRLFTMDENGPRGYANLQSLSVKESATLPKSTMIGDVSGEDIAALVRNARGSEDDLPDEPEEEAKSYAHNIRISNAKACVSMNFTIITPEQGEYTYKSLLKVLYGLGFAAKERTCPASGFYVSDSNLKGVIGVYCASVTDIGYRYVDIASFSNQTLTFRDALNEDVATATLTDQWGLVDVVYECHGLA